MPEIITHEPREDFHDVCPGISISRQPQYAGNTMRTHWHERLELWRMLEGEFDIVCEREAVTVHQGNIVIFNPCEVHSAQITHDAQIDCYIIDLTRLAGRMDSGMERLFSQMIGGSVRFCHRIEEDSVLWSWLDEARRMAVSFERDDTLSMSLFGLFYLVLGRLCREYVYVHEEHRKQKQGDEISMILNFIYSNYTKRLTLDDMAQHLCFSKSYFCRWFKNKTGESPMDYLNTIRVWRAYELLQNTSLSVTEIGYQVGFADIRCFHRQFKRRMSFSPSQVRRHK